MKDQIEPKSNNLRFLKCLVVFVFLVGFQSWESPWKLNPLVAKSHFCSQGELDKGVLEREWTRYVRETIRNSSKRWWDPLRNLPLKSMPLTFLIENFFLCKKNPLPQKVDVGYTWDNSNIKVQHVEICRSKFGSQVDRTPVQQQVVEPDRTAAMRCERF